MGFGEMLGVKQKKLELKHEYATIQDLYEAIKDIKFTAGQPQLVKQIGYVIAFPQLDRNNQVQIAAGPKGKYYCQRSAQPAGIGNAVANAALDTISSGWTSVSGAFGNTKKRCMELVDTTVTELSKEDV